MRKLSIGQLRVLSNFFNTIAAAWFTGGVVTPFFVKPAVLIEKVILSSVGIFFAFVFLSSALIIVRRVES
jgi:hypothetical protein